MEILLEILRAIDRVLSNAVVRWILLATAVAALTTAVWAKAQLGTARLQRDAARGQVATYQAHMEVQNAAVRQLDADTKNAKAKIAGAKKEAARIQDELDKWKRKPPVFAGTCDEMVQQAIVEVRK